MARRAARRRRVGVFGIGGLLVVAIIVAVVVAVTSAVGSAAAPMGPEGIAIEEGSPLAANTTSSTGAPADGVQCSTSEQTAYHIHVHVAVYVDGRLRPIPLGVGIVEPQVTGTGANAFADGATKCLYWLHVHAQDGIVHIESPTEQHYTLGQFFAVWQQPLSSTRVGSATGRQTVFVDGKRYTGDPADIGFAEHRTIQIDVGQVVPYRSVDWSKAQL